MKCGPKIKTRIYRNRNAFFGGGKHILWVGHYWGTKKATDMAWSKFIILDTSIAFMVQKVLVIVRSLLENKIPKIPKILKILRYPSRILGYLEVSLKNNGTTHFSPPMAQKWPTLPKFYPTKLGNPLMVSLILFWGTTFSVAGIFMDPSHEPGLRWFIELHADVPVRKVWLIMVYHGLSHLIRWMGHKSDCSITRGSILPRNSNSSDWKNHHRTANARA